MLSCVISRLVPDVSKDRTSFTSQHTSPVMYSTLKTAKAHRPKVNAPNSTRAKSLISAIPPPPEYSSDLHKPGSSTLLINVTVPGDTHLSSELTTLIICQVKQIGKGLFIEAAISQLHCYHHKEKIKRAQRPLYCRRQ